MRISRNIALVALLFVSSPSYSWSLSGNALTFSSSGAVAAATGSSPASEVFTVAAMLVQSSVTEESTLVDADSNQCGRTFLLIVPLPISCSISSMDRTLTDTCYYCGGIFANAVLIPSGFGEGSSSQKCQVYNAGPGGY